MRVTKAELAEDLTEAYKSNERLRRVISAKDDVIEVLQQQPDQEILHLASQVIQKANSVTYAALSLLKYDKTEQAPNRTPR